MNLFAISGLLVSIGCSLLTMIALIKGKTKLHRILAIFNIAVAVWGGGLFIAGRATTESIALFGWKLGHVGGIFIAVFFYHLVCAFCELKRKKSLIFTYLIGLIYVWFDVATDLLIKRVRLAFGSIYFNDATGFYYILIGGWLFLVGWSFFELIRFLPTAKGDKHRETLYMIFGFLIGFLGGISTLLPEFRIDILYPCGNFGIIIYCLIITYAIFKYQLMDIKVGISRSIIIAMIFTVVMGIPLGLHFMNPFTVAGLVLATTCILLVFIVLVYGKTKLHYIWIFFNLSVALWGFGAFLIGRAATVSSAIIAWRLAHIGIIFIPVCFLHTICIFTEIESQRKKIIILAYLQGIFFLLLNATNLFISQVRWVFNSFYYTQSTGLFYPIFFIIWVGLVIWGHYELVKFYLTSQGVKKNQTLYFFVGMLTGFLGGITNFPPVFKIDLYPFGNFTIPLYCFIVTYAILKYRLMDIKVVVTTTGVFLTVYSLVLVIPFGVGYYLGTRFWFIPTSLMFVFASVGQVVYRFLQKRAEDLILIQQRRYQQILLRSTVGMVKEHNLDRLLRFIVYIVKKTVDIEFAAVFIEDSQENAYRMAALRGRKSIYYGLFFSYDHPLINYMKQSKEPFLYEEISPWVKTSFDSNLGIDLVVPSFIGDKLSGFLFLGEKVNKGHYTQDDIDVFKVLSGQAALAMENCFFFEEFKDVQKRLFQAEKLASIGGMADGVAHQIKNRLNLFSIASGELKLEIQDFIRNNPQLIEQNQALNKTLEYAVKIADSLVTNVKRTDSVIRGILNYARVEEKDTFFSYFSLQEVVELSLELLRVKHEIAEFPLVREIDSSSDMIYGIKAQIMEAVYNVMDNCYEAVKEKISCHLNEEQKKNFAAEIKIKLSSNDDCHLIIISDNGVGIKEDDHKKIFAPFFTTKSSYKSGTGIGIYVVKRMVEENHHGRIWFESQYLQGTTFFIELPKKGNR